MNLMLHRARIYDVGKNGDDRVTVRIWPEMADYSEDQADMFPKYAPFKKGTAIVGKTEKEDGAKDADFCWVACSPDFEVGYIIDLASYQGDQTSSKYSGSYAFNKAKSFTQKLRALTNRILYKDMRLMYSTQGDSGSMIMLTNFRTGDFFMILSSGTSVAINKERIMIRCGSGSGQAYSYITLVPNTIEIKADNIIIDGKNVSLGKNGAYLAAFSGQIPIAVDGQCIFPLFNVGV